MFLKRTCAVLGELTLARPERQLVGVEWNWGAEASLGLLPSSVRVSSVLTWLAAPPICVSPQAPVRQARLWEEPCGAHEWPQHSLWELGSWAWVAYPPHTRRVPPRGQGRASAAVGVRFGLRTA